MSRKDIFIPRNVRFHLIISHRSLLYSFHNKLQFWETMIPKSDRLQFLLITVFIPSLVIQGLKRFVEMARYLGY
jgi:hypothetical protein